MAKCNNSDSISSFIFVELPGIDQQSDVGFITLMEQMRYITVGSFYKNPKNPVWIMGSETHLTGKFGTLKKQKQILNAFSSFV